MICPKTNFHKDKSKEDGLFHQCKPCRNKQRKEYDSENRSKRREYYLKNCDRNKNYQTDNREKKKEFLKNKIENNLNFN